MMAALFFRQVVRCRSRQLSLTLIFPPRNHFACGSFHSSTLVHGWNQCSAFACSPQKPSGSSFARCQSFSYSAMLLTWAWAENSFDGGNSRVSLRTLVMFGVAAGVDMQTP